VNRGEIRCKIRAYRGGREPDLRPPHQVHELPPAPLDERHLQPRKPPTSMKEHESHSPPAPPDGRHLRPPNPPPPLSSSLSQNFADSGMLNESEARMERGFVQHLPLRDILGGGRGSQFAFSVVPLAGGAPRGSADSGPQHSQVRDGLEEAERAATWNQRKRKRRGTEDRIFQSEILRIASIVSIYKYCNT
jgi:hypothetical protein